MTFHLARRAIRHYPVGTCDISLATMAFRDRPAEHASGALPGARVMCERRREAVDIETCFSCPRRCAAARSALGLWREADVGRLERSRLVVRTTLDP